MKWILVPEHLVSQSYRPLPPLPEAEVEALARVIAEARMTDAYDYMSARGQDRHLALAVIAHFDETTVKQITVEKNDGTSNDTYEGNL